MTETVQTPEDIRNPEASAGLGGAELSELLDNALRKAVQAQIGAEAKKLAEGVVADLLTDEVRAEMRATAIVEAEDALNPALSATDPEPPGPDSGPDEEAEAEPELMYATVEEFVEEFVVPTYRREVAHGQRMFKWCPQWAAHGEVYARFKVAHRAFEAMRLDETVEPSLWWLTHLDPHMAVILSPDGPFKHCSPRGHSSELGPLPTTEAPAGTATDGFIPSVFGLWVPASAPARPREVAREYPG